MTSSIPAHYRHKIKTSAELRLIIGTPPRIKKVILCHGVFDIVHPGHIRHLIYAKSKADILITSLTADCHIEKGRYRPHIPQDLRALNLAAFEMVDYVLIDVNAKPLENISLIQPDFFAKGFEYTPNEQVNPKTQEEIDILESYGGKVIFTPGDVVYSSSRLIEMAPPKIKMDKLLSAMETAKITFADMRMTLEKMSGKRVHIVGDTIVDSLTYCTMIGGQTKTPTMSVRFERRADYIGGAGIVAMHMKTAGADVVFSTVLGDDANKDFVMNGLSESGVDVRAMIDPTRPTVNKNAFVAADYRLLKVDTLDNISISDNILTKLAQSISRTEAQSIIFSDFRHGLFNRRTIPTLCAAIPEGVFKVADSQVASRWGNIIDFQGFDLITPNEREARFALADQDSNIVTLSGDLLRETRCQTLILKLGSRGVVVTNRALDQNKTFNDFFVIDSFADSIVDAVGAGDALLAYATLAKLAGGNDVMATILGSMAAASECEVEGNIPITPKDVLAKIDLAEQQAQFS